MVAKWLKTAKVAQGDVSLCHNTQWWANLFYILYSILYSDDNLECDIKMDIKSDKSL